MSKNRIVRVFFDTDMRNGIDGMIALAEEEKVKVSNLSAGEFLVFINARRTIMKVFASKDVYAYYRSPSGAINLHMVAHLPNYFNGSRINFDGALKEALLKGGVKE